MRAKSRDEGMVSAFVVAIALALFVASGLALDSGRLIAARVDAADHAENAARLAAQEVVGIRAGNPVIDSTRGRRVVEQYFTTHDVSGEVRFDGRSVTVEVHSVVDMTILRLAGVPAKELSVTRTAEITDA